MDRIMALDKSGKPIIPEYPPDRAIDILVEECTQLAQGIVRADVAAIKTRWILGKKILVWKDMHRTWYGQHLVENLATKIGLSDKTLYSYVNVAEMWPIEKQFDAFIEEQRKFYGEVRWYKVRLGPNPDTATDPKPFGSPEIHTDHILTSAEAAVNIMKRHLRHLSKNTETSSDQVDQAKGTLLHLGESFLSMAKTIEYRPQLDEDVEAIEVSPDIENRIWTDGERDEFFSWIRTLPCAACGRGGGIEVAHFPKTRAVGDMLHVVPLCKIHHLEQHQHGIKTFLDDWGERIMEWWAKWPSMYWRYYNATKSS